MGLMDKLMEKKGSKPLDPMYKDAKMSMLQELRNSMSGMMKDDLSGAKNGLKKVEVAGSSPEAIADGLDKAKEMVDGEESEEDAAPDLSSMMGPESAEDLTPDKIDMLIEMLQKKKMEMGGEDEPEDKGGMI